MAASSGGLQLIDWLRRSHVSKGAFADELGISRPRLSQYLHGQRRPSLELLAAIASRTGVPIVAWVDTRVSETDEIAEKNAVNDRIHRVLTGVGES